LARLSSSATRLSPSLLGSIRRVAASAANFMTRATRDQEIVEISVADNGSGLAPEIEEHLF
jgi:signal transduction histidine kinase